MSYIIMTDLKEFDLSKQTKPYRQDIFFSLKDMLSLGVKWFTSSLKWIVGVPLSWKNQVTKELSRYEKRIKRMRTL